MIALHFIRIILSVAIFSIPGLFEDFEKNLETALPIALNYDHHSQTVQNWITKNINQFYFDNDLTKESVTNVTNVSTWQMIFH